MSSEQRLINKLQSALSAKTVAEKEILIELGKIREVCDQREKTFDKFKTEEKKLLDQLKNLDLEHKMPALLKGRVSSAANIQNISAIMQGKLEKCRENLEASYVELQRARNREQETLDILNKNKVEQKQIEKIIENKSFLSNLVKQTTEEISIEELLIQRDK